MTANVKVGGTWYESTAISAKVSGAWKNVTEGYTRIGGLWKQFFQAGAAYYGAFLNGGTGIFYGADADADGNFYLLWSDGQLIKLDQSGTIAWSRSTAETPTSTIDSSRQGLAVKGSTVAALGADKVMIYSTAGVYQDAYALDFTTNAIALDSSGGIYIAGKDASNYAMVTKLNSSGVHQWTRRTRHENDTINRNNVVFVDDIAGWVLVGGELGDAGVDRIHFEAYDLDGTLITRQRQSTTGRTISSIVSNGTNGLTGGEIPSSDNTVFSLNSTPAFDRSIDFSSTFNNDRAIDNKLAVDPNGDYYWLFGSDNPDRFLIAKLDGTSPTTLVWLRQISLSGASISYTDDAWNIKADAESVYVTSGLTTANDIIIKIASNGSTTGSVTLNGISYSISTPSASLADGSVSTSTITYATQTTAVTSTASSVTDGAGTFTRAKDRF
jgi:hypothetical protein